ncbi:MAG: hypothetical protein ACE5FU_10245 [Nitrospinota bacterium]
MFKSFVNICNSIKTANLLLSLLIFFFIAGALQMPGNPSFDSLQDVKLFQWLEEKPLQTNWWIWGSIIVLGLLAVNTVFCSTTSLLKKKEKRNWQLAIAPQVVHLGFCFILLAHLLSATGSYRKSAVLYEGNTLELGQGTSVFVKKIDFQLQYGRAVDPKAHIQIQSQQAPVKTATISLNNPVFVDGTGIYIKNIFFNQGKAALLETAKDPGALWALLGSILFSFGTALFFLLKIKYKISD